jgi:hypothetical protein
MKRTRICGCAFESLSASARPPMCGITTSVSSSWIGSALASESFKASLPSPAATTL